MAKKVKKPEEPITNVGNLINNFRIDAQIEELRKLIGTIEARIDELEKSKPKD